MGIMGIMGIVLSVLVTWAWWPGATALAASSGGAAERSVVSVARRRIEAVRTPEHRKAYRLEYPEVPAVPERYTLQVATDRTPRARVILLVAGPGPDAMLIHSDGVGLRRSSVPRAELDRVVQTAATIMAVQHVARGEGILFGTVSSSSHTPSHTVILRADGDHPAYAMQVGPTQLRHVHLDDETTLGEVALLWTVEALEPLVGPALERAMPAEPAVRLLVMDWLMRMPTPERVDRGAAMRWLTALGHEGEPRAALLARALGLPALAFQLRVERSEHPAADLAVAICDDDAEVRHRARALLRDRPDAHWALVRGLGCTMPSRAEQREVMRMIETRPWHPVMLESLRVVAHSRRGAHDEALELLLKLERTSSGIEGVQRHIDGHARHDPSVHANADLGSR